MKRRTLPVAVTLAAATTLSLTACGGGNDKSKANDKIAGADAGDSASPSASASASEPSKRP
ncbi:hypothetical protein ACIRBW_34240, partial [Streptomyces sp. NPDC094437]